MTSLAIHPRRPAWRRLCRDERGVSLISALGVLAVVTVLASSALLFTSANTRSAYHSRSNATAADLAEAGVNEAIAILANASNPRSPSALPNGSTTHEGGVASWTAVLAGDTWTITSKSTVPNPTGASDVTRTGS